MDDQFQLTKPKAIQPAAVNKLKQKDESELTPADRMKLRKEQRDLAEFENLKKAAAAAHNESTLRKQMEAQQFAGTVGSMLTNADRVASN